MGAFVRNLEAAIRSLKEQRQRAILSATGIMVGSLAIVLLISIAKGVQVDITRQVEDLGVNVLVVMPGRIESGAMFNPNLGGQSFLRPQDAEALTSVPGVVRTATITFAGGGVRVGKKEAYPIVIAATPNWFRMRKVELREGQVYTEANENKLVCVIGSVAAKQLFDNETGIVGKRVTINKADYEIIGVTEDKETEQSLFSMGGFQNVVYVPTAAFRAQNPNAQTDRIMVQSAPDAEPKALQKNLDAALGKGLDRQQYSVLTQEDLLGLVYKLMSILTWLLTGLTSIALFVGGVGIMTVMLMSVNERAKEIGIRKTVGARRSDIFTQFLCEAVILAILGGLAGLAISAVVCVFLNLYTPVKPLITADTVILSFAVSIGVGAFFGLVPAVRAAQKDPVQAVRMES